jgi:hypothetical protein
MKRICFTKKTMILAAACLVGSASLQASAKISCGQVDGVYLTKIYKVDENLNKEGSPIGRSLIKLDKNGTVFASDSDQQGESEAFPGAEFGFSPFGDEVGLWQCADDIINITVYNFTMPELDARGVPGTDDGTDAFGSNPAQRLVRLDIKLVESGMPVYTLEGLARLKAYIMDLNTPVDNADDAVDDQSTELFTDHNWFEARKVAIHPIP